ncbi:protein WHAT'S THIS FACTOR 1 homolog, chloroplastic [Aristolochia californica]|uniref:protein WHAT'S THIS FACTOR 1 homolog, chloroplastic n=1 Tax=Aristolochia californica TaxID=171875 RepID=UPI0035D5A23E
MVIKHLSALLFRCSNYHALIFCSSQRRHFSVWSSPKDPALESALSRNRRWIVNNQIKNIILRYPNQTPPVKFIQKKFKTLDLQGKALNWLKKYPCCFEVFTEGDENYCRLTKRMISLVEDEGSVQSSREPLLVEKLAKVLLLSCNHRLHVVKLNELRRNFGFPDDYLLRIVPKYPEMFRIINNSGRRNSMEIEIISYDPELTVSVIEAKAREMNAEPRFTCCLPVSWEKSWQRFGEFNEKLPYISPYTCAVLDQVIMEKRAVALVHELLSLMLWKRASIVKLGHFRREFALPEKLNRMLLRHPGIFYVSNKYQIYTVVLREGYLGSELVEKDPLVLVKENFGELMQEGVHEYNRRRCQVNLEKKRRKGLLKVRTDTEMSEDDKPAGQAPELYKSEERKRFYKVLFDDNVTWE